MSVDGKKKEFLGSIYRDGRLWVEKDGELARWDHDFPFLAEGKVTPFGIFDLFNNAGFMVLGEGSETPRFVVDSLSLWWRYRGCYDYPEATELLVLADSGGGCSYRCHLLKQQLQQFSDRYGLIVRMAHFPPGCSKWNYIEHRLFPHVSRSIQGVALTDHEQVAELMERTTTSTGLTVKAHCLPGEYPTGEKATRDYFECPPAIHDEILPDLNYMFLPRILWEDWENAVSRN